MPRVVLLRHGESAWNLENRFTGWTDVDITPKGAEEAREAGRQLKAAGYQFDQVFCSVLKRAIRTAWTVLDEMDQMWVPIELHWRLNERFYGALQGLNKAETAAKHGADQVKVWRRSYDIPPPPLSEDDDRHPRHDPRYRHLTADQLPATESLKDTVARFLPYWHETIAPAIREGKCALVAAHGNSLRALVMYLDRLSEQAVVELNIPTGVPLVYELQDDLSPVKSYYLGDQEAIRKAAEAVAKQGAAKA